MPFPRVVLFPRTVIAVASCTPLHGTPTGNVVVKLPDLWQAKLTNFACLSFAE